MNQREIRAEFNFPKISYFRAKNRSQIFSNQISNRKREQIFYSGIGRAGFPRAQKISLFQLLYIFLTHFFFRLTCRICPDEGSTRGPARKCPDEGRHGGLIGNVPMRGRDGGLIGNGGFGPAILFLTPPRVRGWVLFEPLEEKPRPLRRD